MAKGDQVTPTCPYCRRHLTVELNNGRVVGVRE